MPEPTPAPAPEPTPDPEPTPEPEPKPDPDLGDAGKAAIKAERAERAKAEKALKAVQADLAKLQQDAMSDQEKAVAAARNEGRTEAITAANERILTAEVKAAASGFANPADALAFIDRDGLVGDDGTVDEAAIAERLAAVLAEKPYLAATPGKTPAPQVPKGSQGTPGVLSLDDQILEAQAKGDVKKFMALNSQKLLKSATS